MNRVHAAGGIAVLAAAITAALPFDARPSTPMAPSRVMVHCPNGNTGAFVTPASITIAVGDTVEWRMTGEVVSDSIIISLKNPEQQWPFTGAPARGGNVARSGSAQARGTYGYNVSLICRLPGGGTQPVVIDPDIIIE